MTTSTLTVDGEVQSSLVLTHEALAGFDESDQVRDVSRFHPTRSGDGVAAETLIIGGYDELTRHLNSKGAAGTSKKARNDPSAMR